ncbi:DUF6169 family protein [Fibrella aquatilis]|uniref:Uncharacterized protein n=1 Tax=Fibrella aquatilis TaxID=2817059 RepID=A0A939K340_9BACT|nr:DUF6169 family protein [Fibrella aquatilis]MBO0934736.1 hypothetical protein [Fibrella aquatilis]
MKKEEPPLLGYNYIFIGGVDSVYGFITNNNNSYEVKFKPSPYALGDDFAFGEHIYELVLKVVDSPTDKNPPFDALTAPTVAAIIKDFYDRSSLTITIYICDTSDRREMARWYKFNRWYDHFNANNYFRADQAVLDEKDGVLYHCAFIIKANNPNKMAVITAFNRLMDGYNVAK